MLYFRTLRFQHVYPDVDGVAISVIVDRSDGHCVRLEFASHRDPDQWVKLNAGGVVEVTQALEDSLDAIDFNLPLSDSDGSISNLMITTRPEWYVADPRPASNDWRALVAIHGTRPLHPALLAAGELIELHNTIAEANEYLA